ncbi:MAG: hypothetical protein ACPGVG_03485 [Mycobacterium sp.]
MSEATPPPETSEPTTGSVRPPPPLGVGLPPTGSVPVYVERSSRLAKAAAWVGIVAGSLFIVVVIFGTGFFLGQHVDNGPRGHDRKGHEMVLPPGGPGTPPMGPGDECERPTGFAGPFGPGCIR